MRIAASIVFLVLMLTGYWLFAPPSMVDASIPGDADAIARGSYLVHAAGCISCHGDESNPEALTGGRALESPFGTFYVPNITPDPETGIGEWTGSDFLNALKHGRSPNGGFYFPAFPYRAYAGMTDTDVLDIAAWLMAQPAIAASPPAHELPTWLGRWQIAFWNRIADLAAPDYEVSPDPVMARGAYLARNLGHCSECHTPRNSLGIPRHDLEYSGAVTGESEADAINAEALDGWSQEDFAFFLFLGMKPDGEYVGGEMEPVIEFNTSPLTNEDRNALAAFSLQHD